MWGFGVSWFRFYGFRASGVWGLGLRASVRWRLCLQELCSIVRRLRKRQAVYETLSACRIRQLRITLECCVLCIVLRSACVRACVCAWAFVPWCAYLCASLHFRIAPSPIMVPPFRFHDTLGWCIRECRIRCFRSFEAPTLRVSILR